MSKLLELASVVYFGSVSYLYFLAFTEDLSTKHGATSDEYLTFRKKFSSFGGRWKFLTHLNLVNKTPLKNLFIFFINFKIKNSINPI
jgi:hypothetical protein